MTESMKLRRRIGIAFLSFGLAGLLVGAASVRLASNSGMANLFEIIAVVLALGSVLFIGSGTVALIKSTRP